MKKFWIYDLETLSIIFTATFEDRDSNEIRTFIISNSKNEKKKLLEFLDNEVAGLIGYNCLTFDSQILEFIFKNPNCSVKEISDYASNIIEDNNKFPDVPEYKLKISHLDLFRALSLSVKAKRIGLKWCEFMMDLSNIEDMPDEFTEEDILSYNYNDVYATKQLYLRYYKEIELRKQISKEEGINLLNSTEPDLSKKLFLKWISEAMNIDSKELKSTRGTDRILVNVENIIFPYIQFKTSKLQEVLKRFQQLNLVENESFEVEIVYGEIVITYGLGGIHGIKKNIIIESNNDYVIKSCDVVSYYPNLAIKNKLHPVHIPAEIFCPLYEGLFIKRRNIPKSNPQNYILKIALNSLYGLTNDEYSFLRDRQYTLAICINGQLLLSMLFEELLTNIPNSKLIMVNTDGFEIYIPKKYEQSYLEICKSWETLTKLELEYEDYKKMIIADVNNYISLYVNGKTKCKGKFEFKDIPLHKNKSHNIIPIALYEYFVNNKSIEETIKNHRNIFDFCAGIKNSHSKKGKSWYELHSIQGSDIKIEKLSKTVRYFISNKGKYLIKKYDDGTFAHVEAPKKNKSTKIKDWKVTYFNKAYILDNFVDYNIDYSYYISKTRDIILNIENNLQLKLF